MQMVIPFAMMFLIFWFLILRPQRKEQETHQKFLAGLKVGDEVFTASGILGRVTSVEDRLITLEIARNTKIQILKSQIQGSKSKVMSDAEAAPGLKTEKQDSKKLKSDNDDIEDAVIEESDKADKKKAW